MEFTHRNPRSLRISLFHGMHSATGKQTYSASVTA